MRLLAVLLALALVLSGCAEKKDEDPEPSSTTSTSTSRSATSTGGVGGTVATNQPPTAVLTANSTGDLPLNVTFVLNATDNDGDALAWILDFGDNATQNGSFPATLGNASKPFAHHANVTHTYAAAGSYNATLRLSDGKATTNVTLNLTLVAGTPFTQFVAEGTPDLSCTQCSEAGANTGLGYRAGINELDSFFVEIPADAAGQPFTVTSSGGDPDVSFRDSCASSGAAVESFNADGPESGLVPAGALCALMWEYAEPGSTITLTIG